ncbi:hypothetical protein C0J52_24719 [Blattella germanica]|nr:hypothetical protein C0J52_24719 [Blattella germanica]
MEMISFLFDSENSRIFRYVAYPGCQVVLLHIGTAASFEPYCNSPIQCVNTTHFTLCMGYEKGYTHRWERPIPCLQGSFCNVSRCQEIYPQPPFITGTKQCNDHGFTCGTRSNEFRVCKYDRFNNSAPMSWDFICPQNTVCDASYRFFCRDSGFNPGQVQPPQPPPAGFNFPTLAPPSNQMPSNPAQQIRDDCKGKGFVCADSKSYLVCKYNANERAIKPDPEKHKCPKKHVCHKSFDQPCTSSANNSHGFGMGIFATVVLLHIGTAASFEPYCNSPIQCVNTTHFTLCMGYEKGYTHRWDRPFPCLQGSFCNVSRCQEIYPQPPFIVGTKQCNDYGFTCGTRSNEFRVCKYDRFSNSAPMSWDFLCPQNTVCDGSYRFFCRDSGFNPGRVQPPQPPPPGFNFPALAPPSNIMPSNRTLQIRDDCKGKGFVCADSKSYLLCKYYLNERAIKPDPEKFKCPKKHVCHKSFALPCTRY